jgi:DoxX-like protein
MTKSCRQSSFLSGRGARRIRGVTKSKGESTMVAITMEQGSGKARANRAIPTYAFWIVQGLLMLLFLFTGGMKLIVPLDVLLKQMPIPLPGLFVFLGAAEVLDAIGLLRIRMVLTPLAACGLFVIMIGATVYTLAGGGGAGALLPPVVGLLLAFVAFAFGRWSHLSAV